MAFWKHLGRKTVEQKRWNETKKAGSPLNNNNNKQNFLNPSTISLAANGDLGESFTNSIPESFGSRDLFSQQSEKLNSIDNEVFGDLGEYSSPDLLRLRLKKSRLSKNLQETLIDLTSLSYFQQYLESKEAMSYLSLLNDLRNFNLLSTSLSSCVRTSAFHSDDSLSEYRDSPKKDVALSRSHNSTSNTSGFSDDSVLDSPSDAPNRFRRMETETMIHNVQSEKSRIYFKYFHPESSDYLPNLGESFGQQIGESITSENADLDLDCFYEIQNSIWNLLENDYFPEYLSSEYHYKYQMEILTGGKLYITDILYNETALFFFMEFMDQENKRHWLEFWMAAENFKLQWNAHNAPSDALVIYNKYFSLQATQPLGLSDVIRSSIEENICFSNGPGPDCFENAVHVVFNTMEKQCLPAFLTSQVYLQYLSEIITAIKNTSCAGLKHRRSGSESTINSEASGISTATGLSGLTSVAGFPPAISIYPSNSSSSNLSGLSMAENTMIKLVNNISNESLVIDTRQIVDPDTLWKRKKYTLSLGHLTPLGRFCPEIERWPDKKTESKLSKAVKKFVNLEDQTNEDLAWQVAAMIVKEVMAVTVEAARNVVTKRSCENDESGKVNGDPT